MHVCGFHFYSGQMGKQVPAHHYCTHLTEDFCQCVIYDNDTVGSKLIGIEYIISEKLYNTLPDEEKKLWHSHIAEVKEGLITTPRVPEIAEYETMKKLVGTYGKTMHTWQIDRGDPLPIGPPQLMMAFTSDKQIDESLIRDRDKKYGVNHEKLKEQRKDIVPPKKHPLADHWEKSGKAHQYEIKTIDMKADR